MGYNQSTEWKPKRLLAADYDTNEKNVRIAPPSVRLWRGLTCGPAIICATDSCKSTTELP